MWHDLHEDLADLPDDYHDKWCITEHNIYCVAFYDRRLAVWIGTDLATGYDMPIRAWHDLPEFGGIPI